MNAVPKAEVAPFIEGANGDSDAVVRFDVGAHLNYGETFNRAASGWVRSYAVEIDGDETHHGIDPLDAMDVYLAAAGSPIRSVNTEHSRISRFRTGLRFTARSAKLTMSLLRTSFAHLIGKCDG